MSKTTKKKSASKGKAKPVDPDLVPLKEAMEKPEKKLSCLDAAAQVLTANRDPMTCGAMIAKMMGKGMWTTNAPTPAATLYSAILREMKTKGDKARFTKVGRGLFAHNG